MATELSNEDGNTTANMTERDSWFIHYDDGDEKELGKREKEEALQYATNDVSVNPAVQKKQS